MHLDYPVAIILFDMFCVYGQVIHVQPTWVSIASNIFFRERIDSPSVLSRNNRFTLSREFNDEDHNIYNN